MPAWNPRSRQAITRARDVLRLGGQPEVARWLDTLLQTDPETTQVVVLGEVKRGKSSLLNALVGADLLPVGVDVTTGGFIRVVPGAEAGARILDAGRAHPVAVADALEAATLGGGARGVEVVHQVRWLPDVALVDTPGLGGMRSEHGELALRQAQDAGVLLVVLDAGQVVTAPEVQVVAEAVGRVPEVVVALARTDRHPQSWRQVLAEDVRILEAACGPVEVVPVSAALAGQAGLAEQAGDQASASLLWQASGVPALADILAARAQRAEDWPARNAAASARTGLERLRDQLAAERDALDGRTSRQAELTQRRDRLRELTDHNARWPLDLQRDLSRLKQDMGAHITATLEEIQSQWDHELPTLTGRWTEQRLQAVAARLDAALRVAAAQVVDELNVRLYGLVNRMFSAFDSDFDLRPFVPAAPPGRGPVRVPPRRTPVVDPSVVSIAMIGAGLAPQFGSLVGIATGVGLFHPAGLLFAGGLVAVNVAFRGARAGRQQVSEVVSDAVRHLRNDLLGHVDAVITEVSPEIRVAYAAEVRRATDAVNTELAAAETARRAAAAEIDAARTAVDKKMAVVQKVLAEVTDVLGDERDRGSGTNGDDADSEGQSTRVGPG